MAKTPPKKDETGGDEKAGGDAKPKKSKAKLLIVIGVALVLLLGGGAAFILLLKKNAAGGHEEAKAQPMKPPLFVTLEPFTVNLQPENGEQYLQAVAALKISDKEVEEQIKLYMPELRHKILLLLSGKKASEISGPEEREKLSDEIRRQVNAILYAAEGRKPPVHTAARPIGKVAAIVTAPAHAASPDDPIQGVLFTSFIVQ
jgi:flagellar FliL protein